MLQTQTTAPPEIYKRQEAKCNDDDATTKTPVHDMREAKPTHTHTQTAVKGWSAESKHGRLSDEEKPSWAEVMQNTDVSSLQADEVPPDSEVLQSSDSSLLVSRKKNSGGDGECASDSLLQIGALQKSMFDMKTEMNEALNVASAMHQSRMDSLEASLDKRDEQQTRVMSERFGDLEQMIQRLEQMLIQRAGPRPAT